MHQLIYYLNNSEFLSQAIFIKFRMILRINRDNLKTQH